MAPRLFSRRSHPLLGSMKFRPREAEPQLLFEPEEDRYQAPHFLPSENGGRKLLYVVLSSGQRQIVVQDLETGQKEFLTSGHDPFFAAPGYILYQSVDLSGVWALPFSIETLQATGEPFPGSRERFPSQCVPRRHTRLLGRWVPVAAVGLAGSNG